MKTGRKISKPHGLKASKDKPFTNLLQRLKKQNKLTHIENTKLSRLSNIN